MQGNTGCRGGGVLAFGRKGVLAVPNGACRASEQEKRSMKTEKKLATMQRGVKVLKNSPRWPWANNQMGNPELSVPRNVGKCQTNTKGL